MERSASTIGKQKFSRMPAPRQHELLAVLAEQAVSCGDTAAFIKRYDELLSWTELDRYVPPPWLSEKEALEEYRSFHTYFSLKKKLPDTSAAPLSWDPVCAVDIVLDQVRSPYNVGSVLRLIDNFGFRGLTHASSWIRLDHPQLHKAARGCEAWIPVRYEPDLPSCLMRARVPVIGIETGREAQPLSAWDPPAACILVLGNESYGIAHTIRGCCDHTVCIPMFGYKKSMNVHHALAVVAQKIVEKATGGAQ